MLHREAMAIFKQMELETIFRGCPKHRMWLLNSYHVPIRLKSSRSIIFHNTLRRKVSHRSRSSPVISLLILLYFHSKWKDDNDFSRKTVSFDSTRTENCDNRLCDHAGLTKPSVPQLSSCLHSTAFIFQGKAALDQKENTFQVLLRYPLPAN